MFAIATQVCESPEIIVLWPSVDSQRNLEEVSVNPMAVSWTGLLQLAQRFSLSLKIYIIQYHHTNQLGDWGPDCQLGLRTCKSVKLRAFTPLCILTVLFAWTLTWSKIVNFVALKWSAHYTYSENEYARKDSALLLKLLPVLYDPYLLRA